MKKNKKMNLVFVSNYLNHHQIPFCNAMFRELDGRFVFIQTQPMEEERVRMGWQVPKEIPYLKLYDKDPQSCQKQINDCDILLYGGTDEEKYIRPRLAMHRPILRYSERLYKEGQWKAISPRGLKKKYEDHGKYRSQPVYLLCSGAYVPSDFHIVRAYPGKMYRWGYFPEARQYDVEQLLTQKGYLRNGKKEIYLLWAARFLKWKQPETAVKAAQYLKEKGISFHLDIIGGGEQESLIRDFIADNGLSGCISLLGYQKPEKVRSYMEKADIFLATSNRQEGWGAVINEAMNSGCAVVADHMMGAAPFLIRQEENGLLYQDGHQEQLNHMVELLCKDKELRMHIGRSAYKTIVQCWNPENAAACLLKLIRQLKLVPEEALPRRGQEPVWIADGPCSPAPVISERQMYHYITHQSYEIH